MSDGVTIKVEGLDELARKIRSLAPKIQDKILGSAVNAGLQIVKKDAADRVPVGETHTVNGITHESGMLKRSIFVKRISSNGEGRAEYILGVRQGRKERKRNKDAFYWRFIEFGTKHIAARPFLRPAFESKKNEAFEKIKQTLKSGLDRVVAQKI